MRFTWLDSKALILKSRKELITFLIGAAVVTAVGFAIGSATLASAQDLSLRSSAAEAAFLKENDAAMTKMMNDMAVKPTGDVDHDFVAMMVPHHQGAIEMSEAELRYGQNEQLRRIAQDIVTEQLQEIAAMRAASGEKLTPTEATLAASFAGTAPGLGFSSPGPADNVPPSFKRERPFLAQNDAAMTKMMNDMTIKPTGNIDRDFVAMMVPHHQGAIDMAQAELRYGSEAQLRRIAQEIVVDQIQQISLMRLAVGEPLPPSVSSPTDPTPEPIAGQVPFDQPDISISSHDRVYTADASMGDFYTSYTHAKVIAHVPLSGGSPQQIFLQQVGRREYLYLQQASSRGFTVIDVSKPAKPKVVTHVPRENLTLVASGLAIAEEPGSTAGGSSGADENAESTRGAGSAPQQIRVLDVSDPAHPRTVQNFIGVTSVLPDDARGLIYVANGDGIWILSHQQVLRRHLCSSSDEISPMPNCD